MTQSNDDASTSQYAGPPQSQGYQQPQQVSPSSSYSVQSGYPAPPGYPPNPDYPPPYGYPPYGYQMPRGPVRPGGATAAAVLMFIQAAVVIVSTLYVLIGASALGFAGSYGEPSGNSLGTEFTVIGILQLVSAGALIFGGVQLLSGSSRVLAIVACGVQLVFVVYWMVRIGTIADFSSDNDPVFFVVPLMYAVLPGVALPLSLNNTAAYIQAKRSQRNVASA